MADQLIPINILIGDRSYRIKTLPKDEEVIRKTLKVINQKISEFKTQFAGKDMQDYIAMVLIWYATESASADASQHLQEEFAETLRKIDSQISRAL